MEFSVDFPCDKNLTKLFNKKNEICKKHGKSSLMYKNANSKYKKEYNQYWYNFTIWSEKN